MPTFSGTCSSKVPLQTTTALRAGDYYNPDFGRSLSYPEANYPRISSQVYSAIVLFCLGYRHQTLAKSNAAIAEALRLAHPPSLALSFSLGTLPLALVGDNRALDKRADQLVKVTTEQGSPSGVPDGDERQAAIFTPIEESAARPRIAGCGCLRRRIRRNARQPDCRGRRSAPAHLYMCRRLARAPRRPVEARRAVGRSSPWPHDAARWNAGELVDLLKLARQRVAVRTGRAALDVAIVPLPGTAGGDMPQGVVGHRSLDAEHAGVDIGDDQEERVAGVGRGH
jgi:hypothetical protein